jgi:hypothetical protein
VEGLLVGLGGVIGRTVGWVLIALFTLVLAAEAVQWARGRRSRPLPADLDRRLDELLRAGINLREELSVPVEPEESAPGVWTQVGGVPGGWWEKVDAFDQRNRDLLRAEHPALLSTYAGGHNSHVRAKNRDREQSETVGVRERPLSVLEFFNATRDAPVLHMDAILEGLAAARRQLGTESLKRG